MRALLLALMIVEALCAPIYFQAKPLSYITPPSSTVKLREDIINLALDPSAGTFSFNFTTYVSIQGGFIGYVPVVTVSGNLGFTDQQDIQFSAANISISCTQPTSVEISLCPYLATIVLGSWSFDYHLNGASTTDWISINTGVPQFNANGVPQQFLGMNFNPTYYCVAPPCASLATAVPPAPLPQNGSFTVRCRFFDKIS